MNRSVLNPHVDWFEIDGFIAVPHRARKYNRSGRLRAGGPRKPGSDENYQE